MVGANIKLLPPTMAEEQVPVINPWHASWSPTNEEEHPVSMVMLRGEGSSTRRLSS